jgi:hypothetical protein
MILRHNSVFEWWMRALNEKVTLGQRDFEPILAAVWRLFLAGFHAFGLSVRMKGFAMCCPSIAINSWLGLSHIPPWNPLKF